MARKWPSRYPDRIQLYSVPTPNGVKVAIMLEETGLPYEPHFVNLEAQEQKSPEFLALNQNGKIPALLDPRGPDGAPVALAESGAILIYLADKSGQFLAKAGAAPGLSFVRLAHDHTGDFAEGIDGINAVETEIADNDYAVGLLIQKVAHGPFGNDTLVFVIEDDAQDGPDHVDAHRSIAFIAGPYVKQGAVIHSRHTTVELVRTIEAVLGLSPMGLNDALARPMADVFDSSKTVWSFDAIVPGVLRSTKLPLPPAGTAEATCPTPVRSGAYWAAAMKGQDFSQEDRLDTARYNLALWRGMRGSAPYPAARDGRDLSQARPASAPPAPCI